MRASIGKVQGGVVLKDQEIVALFWRRDERAVAAAREKYGAYLLRVAMGILPRRQDGEECVNDAYLGAWNSIPPQRPAVLQTYLGKLTRRIAIDRCRRNTAEKRGGGEVALSIDELAECLPDRSTVEEAVELRCITAALDVFLGTLSREKRRAFVLRYWYALPVREVAEILGFSETKTANLLSRTRRSLREHLEKEGLLYG